MMSEINCPNIGKANLQRCFVVLEDVSGVLQRPVASGFILPSGSGSMSQTPGYTNSEELSRSLNVLEQFQDAVEAGWSKRQPGGFVAKFLANCKRRIAQECAALSRMS